VTKYGGWSMVQKVRPVMIGLIAGDMLGAFVPALISAPVLLRHRRAAAELRHHAVRRAGERPR